MGIVYFIASAIGTLTVLVILFLGIKWVVAEPLGGGPTRQMMCNIPGGIRVEFIAPAG